MLEQSFADGFQVVNADSKQIYRYLDIGSAKPSVELMQHIPHHLIDIRDPWEQFSVGDFVKLADTACESIRSEGKIPVICGGTAYYFKHFYYGLPASPQSDPIVRERIAAQVQVQGLDWCYRKLEEIDPVSAKRIHPADGYRITRALEVYETSGFPLSSFSVPTEARDGMRPLIIGLTRDKAELDERIVQRVRAMFKQGLEQEMDSLLSMGAVPEWPGMQGIGYREFFVAKEHPSMDKDDISQLIIRNSRMYAKRQMTFFRSLPHVHWVHPEDTATLSSLLDTFLANH